MRSTLVNQVAFDIVTLLFPEAGQFSPTEYPGTYLRTVLPPVFIGSHLNPQHNTNTLPDRLSEILSHRSARAGEQGPP